MQSNSPSPLIHPLSCARRTLIGMLLSSSILVSFVACNKSKSPSAVPDAQAPQPPSVVQDQNDVSLAPVPSGTDTLFRRVTAQESGIEFRNLITENNAANILTYSYMYNGGGVAAGDINNDGLVDLFFTSNQGKNCLYLNLGNLKFKDISQTSGIGNSSGWHSGVNMTDINGDGFLDIYVCRSGPGSDRASRSNLLFVNDGNLHFTEQATQYGIADDNHSTQASFFDYDQDGDPDLYVLNHPVFFGFATVGEVMQEIQDPEIAKANSDNLFRNNGDGTFTQVTAPAGCLNLGYGLGLITADLNGDGWTDIYVANDFSTPDRMYINQRDGTFVDELKDRTGHVSYFGMGCDVVDVNSDQHPDIMVLDMTAQDRVRSKTLMPSMSTNQFWALVSRLNYHYQYMFNTLQLNQGEGFYSDIGLLAGVAKTDWSWAVLGADFDHDGWDDLFITNGFRRDSKDNDFLTGFRAAKSAAGGRQAMIDKNMMMDWVTQIPSQKLRNYVYRNNSDLTFSDRTEDWGLIDESFSNGATYADLDNDGDLDLAVNNIDDHAFLFENQADKAYPQRSFVNIQPIDNAGQPVLNAKVLVAANGHTQQKELTTCRGYQSAVASVLHFGLGEATQIDSITVYWPDQTVTVENSLAVNQTHRIGKQQSVEAPQIQTHPLLFSLSANQPPFQHEENLHDEYQSEVLLPHSQSTLGPCLAIADVDGDGLDDIFVGGARGFAPELLIQTEDGDYQPSKSHNWRRYIYSENVDALFFDADGDNDNDLYIVNGGGSDFKPDDPFLCDQFFRNNDGQLILEPSAIPRVPLSTSSVVAFDYDSDGDMDLFVGGRLIPGKYPFAPKSYILENDGGVFQIRDMPELNDLGMVNDAIATDFDADGRLDLIVVGEWTPVIFLKNLGGEFKQIDVPGGEDLRGWWFSVTEMDVNADGRPDYLLGNLGKNNKFKSKSDSQLKLVCDDFDDNGTFDIVLATEINGRDFPVRGKECSSQQMPFLNSKFKTYHEFALADLNEILGNQKLDGALQLKVNTFAHCLLIHQDEGFKRIDLPNLAQIAPIRDAIPLDVNHDGHLDMVAVGNQYSVEVETIRYDAGMGLVLIGNGTGEFKPLRSGESGFRVPKDSRRLALLNTKAGKKLVVANNNDRLMLFDIRSAE